MGTQDYTIKQGETWRRVLRWEQGTFVYKTVTAATATAPVTVTAVDHGLVAGWRFALSNIAGMVNLNAKEEPPNELTEYHTAVVVSSDIVEINDINAKAFPAYISGGVLRYHPPVDLTGYTARMQFRKSAKDAAILLSLTTENGGITVNNSTKTITLLVTKTQTELITYLAAVYDLELINAAGEVTILLSGKITIVLNVTRA